MGSCICYLSLCNKLPKNSAVYNNKNYFLSHSCCGLRIQEELSWAVLAQTLSWGCREDVSWLCSYLKAWLDQEDMLLRWLVHMTGRLVLTVGGREASQQGGLLPAEQSTQEQERARGKLSGLVKTWKHDFHHILPVRSRSLSLLSFQGQGVRPHPWKGG